MESKSTFYPPPHFPLRTSVFVFDQGRNLFELRRC